MLWMHLQVRNAQTKPLPFQFLPLYFFVILLYFYICFFTCISNSADFFYYDDDLVNGNKVMLE